MLPSSIYVLYAYQGQYGKMCVHHIFISALYACHARQIWQNMCASFIHIYPISIGQYGKTCVRPSFISIMCAYMAEQMCVLLIHK